jgi:uncharacterized membrane protein HdeD (DUF308 family)
MQLFLIRGLVAIAWAAVFAMASDSLTTGVTVGAGILLVIYALIDVVASLIDARGQRGSAQRLLRLDAAVSAAAAVAFAVAATGTVADALAVFGAWAAITGAAQLVVALRRCTQLGNQWSMLIAGGLSTPGGIASVIASKLPIDWTDRRPSQPSAARSRRGAQARRTCAGLTNRAGAPRRQCGRGMWLANDAIRHAKASSRPSRCLRTAVTDLARDSGRIAQVERVD